MKKKVITAKCEDCNQIAEVHYNKHVDLILCDKCESERNTQISFQLMIKMAIM
jgi:hypothetical protein